MEGEVVAPDVPTTEEKASSIVVVRMTRALHRRLKAFAGAAGISMNKFVVAELERATTPQEDSGKP